MSAIIILVILGSGCAGTWQQKTRVVLKGTLLAGAAVQRTVGAEGFCEPAIKVCVDRRENPCSALLKCQKARRKILHALVLMYAGIAAVDAALRLTEIDNGS